MNEGFKAAKINLKSEVIKSIKLTDNDYYILEVSNPKDVDEILKLSGMKLQDKELKFIKKIIKQHSNITEPNKNNDEKKEIENIIYEEDNLKKILISNIPHYYLKEDFEYLLADISTIKNILLIEDHATKCAKKYCLVEFESDRQATSVLKCKFYSNIYFI